MNLDLLSTPARRNSILPELVSFFQTECGDDWRNKTEKFIKRFAGCEFTVPGHEAIVEVDRDDKIIKHLAVDDSVAHRLELLREHKITYGYMQQIYACAMGKQLPPPPVHTRAAAVKEAAEWMRRMPAQAAEITGIYSLTAPEFAEARELIPGRRARELSLRAVEKKAAKAAPKTSKTAKKKTAKKTAKTAKKKTAKKTRKTHRR